MTDEACLNCRAALHGAFCHACGQQAVSGHLGMHDFVHDATHEFLHLDGKIWKTIKLLVARPGELTREFLAGRRARYISPVRLYLTFSLIFFTLAAVLPGGQKQIVKVGSTGNLSGDSAFERRLIAGVQKAQTDGTHVSEEVLHNLPKAMFVLMPIFGLLTWAFYRKQQRLYIPHLYYSIHFHAFVFLVMSVYVLISRLAVPRQWVAPLIMVAVPYHFIALRRVFGGTQAMTFAKGTAIGVAYWLIAIVAMLAVTLFVVLTL